MSEEKVLTLRGKKAVWAPAPAGGGGGAPVLGVCNTLLGYSSQKE